MISTFFFSTRNGSPTAGRPSGHPVGTFLNRFPSNDDRLLIEWTDSNLLLFPAVMRCQSVCKPKFLQYLNYGETDFLVNADNISDETQRLF